MISQRFTTVSGTISETSVTIFGYTCKKCKVEITNPYIYSATYSDEKGYFEFNRIIIPKKFSDICLTSTDKHNSQSSPTCIASPPQQRYHTDIGPILLAPTISLNKSQITPYNTIMSEGEGIPNSTIQIHLFKNNDKAKIIPKEVQAYSLPVLTIKLDDEGNFNFNIPTTYQTNFRLFANSIYLNSASPKSNTLIYHLPIYTDYLLYFIFPFIILCLTYIFHWIYKRYLTTIKLWPALRNIQLLPFSSSR